MSREDGFAGFLEGVRAAVDGELERLLPAATTPPARLHEAMRYSLFAGGKRVRPALCLLAGELYGAAREELLPGAAALEMIHTFSLVHDDLPALDDDDLRRGQPTVHRRYDEATAVLVGDALLNLAFAVLAGRPPGVAAERRLRAVALVGEAVGTGGMIGGQMADLEAESDWPEDARGALELIHRRKTGALITASVRLGGLYAGAGEAGDRLLGELGQRLGLMFQIADDILDVEGSDETLGKTAGKDARARKLTYPALLGLDESRALLARVAGEAGELAERLPGDGALMRSLIRFVATRDR